MTIISHKYRFIFLKTRKTAGSSIERWLVPSLGQKDMIATAPENWPLAVSLFSTPDPTTRFPAIERRLKRRVRQFLNWPKSFALREHMSACQVRALVGEEVWRSYFKFCVERSPWDRILSLWRWRQRRFNRSISLDSFLDLIESAPEDKFVRHASNLDSYLIGGVISVDHVVNYDRLSEELSQICSRLRIGVTIDELPRVKAGVRPERDSVLTLSKSQIDRISRLFAREICLWGWQPPSEDTLTGSLSVPSFAPLPKFGDASKPGEADTRTKRR